MTASDLAQLDVYRRGDEDAIITLFERVFGRTMGPSESARHWVWEYRRGPFGTGLVYVARQANTITSHFAVLPRRLLTPRGVRSAAISVDSMTAPEAQGSGLFLALASQSFRAIATQGIQQLFGFPNTSSAPIYFKRLGWLPSSNLLIHAKLLWPWFSSARSRGKGQSHDTRATAELPDSDAVDDLWRRAQPAAAVCVDRSSPYLGWRYVDRPESRYVFVVSGERCLSGLAVAAIEVRYGIAHGALMECLWPREEPSRTAPLLTAMERALRDRGVQIVTCLTGCGGQLRSIIEGHGFIPVPKWLSPHKLEFGTLSLPGGPANHEDWYLTWGDTDLL